MTAALVLPAELTIYSVGELRPAWLDALASADADGLEVDASAVDEIDAAGVQLLVALRHAAAAQQRPLLLHAPSPRLQAACAALGLASLITSIDGATA